MLEKFARSGIYDPTTLRNVRKRKEYMLYNTRSATIFKESVTDVINELEPDTKHARKIKIRMYE